MEWQDPQSRSLFSFLARVSEVAPQCCLDLSTPVPRTSYANP